MCVHTGLKEQKGTYTEMWSSRVSLGNLNGFVKLLYKTHEGVHEHVCFLQCVPNERTCVGLFAGWSQIKQTKLTM